MIALLLLACRHTPPAPLVPPLVKAEIGEVTPDPDGPLDCPEAVVHVDRPVPVPTDAEGRATCGAQLVTTGHLHELTQADDLLPGVVDDLRACERWAALAHATYEDERLRLHRTVAELEAEARAARIAVPLAALGGGLAVGGLVYAGMRLGAAVP